MASRRAGVGFAAVALATILLSSTLGFGMLPLPVDFGTQDETDAAGLSATVTFHAENGTVLGTVEATVVNTSEERYTGLSDHESLANDSGMLFVFDRERNRAFVMRDMDFPLDMVFIGTDGEITTIHEAPLPPEDTSNHELERYEGQAQWVLEVPRGWTAENDIEEGDRVEIEYHDEAVEITTVPGESDRTSS